MQAAADRSVPLYKYWSVFALSLQQEFYYRASFLMERARSITIIVAFYAFWSAIFQDRAELAGYNRSEMFTYILGMNVLRAFIFSDKTWDVIREINTGKISSYLLRPISYIGYCVSRDLAEKVTHLMSAAVEVSIVVWLLKVPLTYPASAQGWGQFALSVALAMALYFLMSYAVSALAFWTAESGGPRFCFELFLEFASGAFFPLNILPDALRKTFEILPFAPLLYFPLNVFMGKLDAAAFARGIAVQLIWIAVFAFLARVIWKRGLQVYSAEGG